MPTAYTTDRPLKLAVLISGAGTTLANLIQQIEAGHLRHVSISLVISSRATVRGVEIARDANLPTRIIRPQDYDSPVAFSAAIADACDEAGIDLVVMAGFLCKWLFPPRYDRRIINIHPALLPEFGGQGMYGRHVHEAVLAAGRQHSGCTVHLVDHEYDHGPTIAQATVPVRPDDTPAALADRVMQAERELYPAVIQRIADEGLEVLHQLP